ncbi:MAG: HU family DNA-binding protein [Spirochaetota bacterium]|nr:HU family DNA-binding protein [Spirochaetota bacterium]
MTKHEIVDSLTRQSGIKRKEVLQIINNFLDIIIKTVDNNERVEFRGFGCFYRALRRGRRVYSPIVRGSINIPPKSVLSFKASKSTERDPV